MGAVIKERRQQSCTFPVPTSPLWPSPWYFYIVLRIHLRFTYKTPGLKESFMTPLPLPLPPPRPPPPLINQQTSPRALQLSPVCV